LADARNLDQGMAVADAAVAQTSAPAAPIRNRVNQRVHDAVLEQTWCFSFRYQLTFASMLLRFKRCVPVLK